MTTVNTTALTVKLPTTMTPPRLRNLKARSVSNGARKKTGQGRFRGRDQMSQVIVCVDGKKEVGGRREWGRVFIVS